MTMDDRIVQKRFVQLMRNYPQLYSVVSKTRLDPEWYAISKQMGVPPKELMLKWHRLRDSYRADLRQERDLPPEVFVPKFHLFEEMQYLRSYELKRIRLRKPAGAKKSRGRKRSVEMPQPKFDVKNVKVEPVLPPTEYDSGEQLSPEELPYIKQEPQSTTPEVPAIKQERPEEPASKQTPTPPQQRKACVERCACKYCIPAPEVDVNMDFLQTRILPYLLCLPDKRRIEVSWQMHRLLYNEYMQQRRIQQSNTGNSLLLSSQSSKNVKPADSVDPHAFI